MPMVCTTCAQVCLELQQWQELLLELLSELLLALKLVRVAPHTHARARRVHTARARSHAPALAQCQLPIHCCNGMRRQRH